jgi:hypothetical protein
LADVIRDRMDVQAALGNGSVARAAVMAVLALHEPDPSWEPLASPCGSCGGTGVVHGPGGNGNWTDDQCCCDHNHCEYCGSCCDPATGELDCARQNGADVRAICEALSITVEEVGADT